MKKLLLLAAVALLAAAPAKAATFTLSQCCGAGPFGTATGAFLANGTTAEITINMNPNYILDTGSHFAATFSLVGTGRVDGTTPRRLQRRQPAELL